MTGKRGLLKFQAEPRPRAYVVLSDWGGGRSRFPTDLPQVKHAWRHDIFAGRSTAGGPRLGSTLQRIAATTRDDSHET